MKIRFPNAALVYMANGAVAFRAQVDGEEVMCEVSPEALEDHFGARPARASRLAAFEQHRARIETVALATIPQRLRDQRCQLFSRDFRQAYA